MKTVKNIDKLTVPNSLIAAGLPHRVLWREFVDSTGRNVIEAVLATRTEVIGRAKVDASLDPMDALSLAVGIWRDELHEEEMLLAAEMESAQHAAELADQEHAGADEEQDGECPHPTDQIEFKAFLGAPGHGKSWECAQCGEAMWGATAELAEPFKNLDPSDYIMSEADVR